MLRDLYKAQGHSSARTMEWDWNKLELHQTSANISGKIDSLSGGGAADATTDNILGASLTNVAAEEVTDRPRVKCLSRMLA